MDGGNGKRKRADSLVVGAGIDVDHVGVADHHTVAVAEFDVGVV